jgi:hypothetical protein
MSLVTACHARPRVCAAPPSDGRRPTMTICVSLSRRTLEPSKYVISAEAPVAARTMSPAPTTAPSDAGTKSAMPWRVRTGPFTAMTAERETTPSRSEASTALAPAPSASAAASTVPAMPRERDVATFASPTHGRPGGRSFAAGGTNATSLGPFGQPSSNDLTRSEIRGRNGVAPRTK